MTEEQLLASVLELCAALRLLAYHTRDSRRSAPGFPDLVIAGPQGTIFRELKSATGQTSAEQDLWGWMLCYNGTGWNVWRPDDWIDGTIRYELEQLARDR